VTRQHARCDATGDGVWHDHRRSLPA